MKCDEMKLSLPPTFKPKMSKYFNKFEGATCQQGQFYSMAQSYVTLQFTSHHSNKYTYYSDCHEIHYYQTIYLLHNYLDIYRTIPQKLNKSLVSAT